MQRKFLEDLGLEKEVIDKIMDENSSDVEKNKSKLEAERGNYKSQLETAQNALKEFEGVDVKELNSKIQALTTDLETQQNEYNAKIADMEFNNVLNEAMSKSGAKNIKAVKALLDLENLKASKNQNFKWVMPLNMLTLTVVKWQGYPLLLQTSKQRQAIS